MKFKCEKKYIFEVLGLDATRATEISEKIQELMKTERNIGAILNEIWNKKSITKKMNERVFLTLILGVEIGKIEVVKLVTESQKDEPMMFG